MPERKPLNVLPELVRIGTRGSSLALWQAEHVAQMMHQMNVATEIVIIRTQGDVDQRTPISQLGSKAIFIKELEEALLEERVDVAVHSLKDLPVEMPAGLKLAAVPERVSPLDAWICPEGFTLETLPAGSAVAMGSLRRAVQVLARRPDLRIVPIRGNVPPRLERLKRGGDARATLLAEAGLRRLGLAEHITEVLTPAVMPPAMGQGALALEAREGVFPVLFERMDDAEAHMAVAAERRFLGVIGGGCKTPVGILARPGAGNGWVLTAMLASEDGRQLMRRTLAGEAGTDAGAPAEELAREMLAVAPPESLATLERLA